MKRTVWVDVTDFLTWKGHYTGIQRVTTMLAGGLKYKMGDRVRFVYYDATLRNFFEADKIRIDKNGVLQGKLRGWRPFDWSTHRIPLRIIRKLYALLFQPRKKVPFSNGDTLFIPGSNLAWPQFGRQVKKIKSENDIKVVHVIHDILPLSTPQFFQKNLRKSYEHYFKEAVEYSDCLVSVSRATDDELYEFFGDLIKRNRAQTQVIRSGSSIDVRETAKPKRFKFKKGEYLLSWGTIEPRKNRELLYMAYKYAIREGIKLPPVVIAGKLGWLSHDLVTIMKDDPEVADLIDIIKSPADEELVWLIQNCRFTVYPSHAEGWGLPIAESLHYGKTCISVNKSAMPEVAGDKIEYIDNSYDPVELVNRINYLNKPANLANAEDKIKGFKPKSWQSTISEYVDLLENV